MLAAAVLTVLFGVLVLAPAGALASLFRAHESSFGAFTQPQAVTVDQSTGGVYVVDVAAGSVSRFTSAGVPAEFSVTKTNVLSGFSFEANAAQVAVAPAGSPGGTEGDIYVVSDLTDNVEIFDANGNHLGALNGSGDASGGFSEACGVATEASTGAVYVADFGGHVWRYTPTTGTVSEVDYSGGIQTAGSVCNVAADAGNVYAGNTYSEGELRSYQASAFVTGPPPAAASTLVDSVSRSVAVDPANGDVYVDEGDQIAVFDSSGASRYTFGSSADFGSTSSGVGVIAANGKAFVADPLAGQVDVYAPAGAPPPVAITNPATTIHHTDAILNGHLEPGGDPSITDCHFDYLTDAAFQANTPAERFAGASTIGCAQGNSFSDSADATALINNLSPGTTYHFRLHITGSTSGDVVGTEQHFTLPPFPSASTQLAAFGPDGTSGSSFGEFNLQSLAFDQVNRRLYASERGATPTTDPGSIYGFDASTPPAFPLLVGFAPLATAPIASPASSGLAVDNTALSSAGHIYFADLDTGGGTESGKVFGFDPAAVPLGGSFPIDPALDPGAPAGLPKRICGDVVDSAGDLWIANQQTAQILRYSSAGAFESSLDISAQFPAPNFALCQLAFDSHDNLYVGDLNGALWRYTAPSYTAATEIEPANSDPRALTVDPSTDTLYVAHEKPASVTLYDSSGKLQGTVATGIPGAVFTGIAVDATNHYVYLADAGNNKIRAFSVAFQKPPTITPGLPTAVAAGTATLNAKVDPENIAVTDCHFDYGVDDSYGHTAPCVPDAVSIGAGSGDVSVHADISGLDGGNAYHFRIVASNAEVGGTATGPDQSLTTLGPLVAATRATDIGDSAATLRADVNPLSHSTTYRFEYGTDSSYGQNAPASPAAIGSGSSAVAVAEHITGLAAATTYHFRLVAASSDGIDYGPDTTFTTPSATAPPDTTCSNQSLRTGAGAVLPDCRAYEQVSPINKNGASVTGSFDFNQAAVDGHAAVFGSYSDLLSTGGHPSRLPAYVASRGPSGWSYDSSTPDPGPGGNVSDIGRDDDLRASLSVVNNSLELTDLATFDRQLILAGVGNDSEVAVDAQFSDDTQHFTFEDTKALVPGAGFGTPNLYDVDHGALTLAGRVPAFPATSCTDGGAPADDCTAPPGGSFAGSYAFSPANLGVPPGDLTQGTGYRQDTISEDGSRIFFTEGATGRLYERNNATTTVQISAPQGTADPSGHKPAAFSAATPDGHTVYFTSCEKLTADSTAVSTGENDCLTSSQGQDLYSYDTGAGTLTDLTPDSHGSDAQAAQVQGVLGVSPDGAYLYFTANGVLASGATPGDCDSAGGSLTGSCSLYLSHGGDISFVARLGGGNSAQHDYTNWMPGPGAGGTAVHTKTARVAASGTLLFSSNRSLTGYDNAGATCNIHVPGNPCDELYRFDPQVDHGTGHLGCVSCDPTGAAPIDDAGLDSDAGAPLFRVPPLGILTRVLSTDGDRVFFETPDKLVPSDTNGDGGCPEAFSTSGGGPVRTCQDVYEWEANGAGSCHSSAQNGGCLFLLSSGTSTAPSRLDDASASGDDVFIYTDTRLVAQDRDDLTDLYDVRVDGGLPSQQQAAPPPCSGDVCQGSPTAPLVLPIAGSVTFAGAGNGHPGSGVSVTAKPRVSSSKTIHGSSAMLSITVPARGLLTVSGTGLRSASVSPIKAGTYKLRVTLSAKARRAWRKSHVLRVKARVVFAPSGGAPATASVTLTFRTATTTKKGR